MASCSNILLISNFIKPSGAEFSMFDLISRTSEKYYYFLTIPKNSYIILPHLTSQTYYLPYIWYYKTLNPYRNLQFFSSLIFSTIKLYRLINKNNIQIIYANTFKAALYGLIIKVFTQKKLIWSARDNMMLNFLKKLLIRYCDVTVSISRHIFNQFPANSNQNYLIYGGLDTNYWKPQKSINNEFLKHNAIQANSIVIACVAQLTRWKNQPDFIKTAMLLSEKKENIHFLIIGDDLSGRERKYKNELVKLVNDLDLQNKVYFLSSGKDIKDIMNNIDILVHPAIDEPFGRVIIEAMSMGKPAVAYNCGGPAEIIKNGETGYLVEPNNYHQLAVKTLELIENGELRITMGKAGRQRVIEKFNIKRYVSEMEEVFDSL